MASEREAALLRQILDHPDDLAARAVYADELQSRGDPRGELIALELAGAGAHAAALRRAHAATWWPELAEHAFATKHGFVHRIRTRANALPALARIFATEPVAELDLEPSTPPLAPFAVRVRRLAIRGEAYVDHATVERLELRVPGLRFATAFPGEWPALRELRVVVDGTLASTWPNTIVAALPRLPRLARLELVDGVLEPGALAALQAAAPHLVVTTSIGDGPFALDLTNATIELTRAHDLLWRVAVDGAPSRVRWRRVTGRTRHTTQDWQIADDAPLEQVAHALAINAA
ncbi:MAG: TIGR02996 domain-containing protein, partial [Kofleriaceae bacterium]